MLRARIRYFLPRQPSTQIWFMVVVEMVKEFTRAKSLTAQLYNVVRWLDQNVIGQAFDDSEQLLKDVL